MKKVLIENLLFSNSHLSWDVGAEKFTLLNFPEAFLLKKLDVRGSSNGKFEEVNLLSADIHSQKTKGCYMQIQIIYL